MKCLKLIILFFLLYSRTYPMNISLEQPPTSSYFHLVQKSLVLVGWTAFILNYTFIDQSDKDFLTFSRDNAGFYFLMGSVLYY